MMDNDDEQPKLVKFTNSAFLCPILILACRKYIFERFKVYKFSLGLCLNNQVKEKQWKWSIVILYDVYQQQVAPKLPKNAVPSSLYVILRMYYAQMVVFISSFQLYFIDTHIYLSFNVPLLIEK